MGATEHERDDSSGEESPLLRVESVDSFYGSARALSDVTFEVPEGGVTGIIGPNGAGKSTLLDCITGFKEYSGTIEFRDEPIEEMAPWDLGGRIAYCTEDGNLFDDMTVAENLKLGGYNAEETLSRNEEYVFDLFPRLEDRRSQMARTLSGGESQMLSIGRGLMTDPDLLILDEPSLGLAPTIIKDISAALDDIYEDGMTVLLAEQNVNLVFDHADTIMLLENGKVAMRGPASELEDEEYIQESYFS
jgi:branched-chain amino acid transport system ATP-binding protein